MSHPNTERDERVSDDEAYRIVEEMGLGLTFRSCSCGQLSCARLRPLREALTTVRKEAREAAFRAVTKAAQTENPPYNAGREYARGFARAKKAIIGKIEAAANTEEGGGDGS